MGIGKRFLSRFLLTGIAILRNRNRTTSNPDSNPVKSGIVTPLVISGRGGQGGRSRGPHRRRGGVQLHRRGRRGRRRQPGGRQRRRGRVQLLERNGIHATCDKTIWPSRPSQVEAVLDYLAPLLFFFSYECLDEMINKRLILRVFIALNNWSSRSDLLLP